MKSYILYIISAALFVAAISAQLTVNTPSFFLLSQLFALFLNPFSGLNVVFCAPLQIVFTSGLVYFPFSFLENGVLVI